MGPGNLNRESGSGIGTTLLSRRRIVNEESGNPLFRSARIFTEG